jgi:hypothetical protein
MLLAANSNPNPDANDEANSNPPDFESLTRQHKDSVYRQMSSTWRAAR